MLPSENPLGASMSAKFRQHFHFSPLASSHNLAFNAPHEAVFSPSTQAIYYSHRLELLFLFLSYNPMAPSRLFCFPLTIFYDT
jgi:hypothetical protein